MQNDIPRAEQRMTNPIATKIGKVGSRHTIHLEKAFVQDSAFPLEVNEHLTVRIEKDKLTIEKG
jgi:hypothetical protein